MKVVIFAGGVGTRLWPLSRKKTPKQFEKIIDDKSTLQLAVNRVLPVVSPSDIYISSGKVYKDILLAQLPEIPKQNFILEPQMRDVGAAVGLVAAIIDKVAPNEPFIILWSDHLVKNEKLFRDILVAASKMLQNEGKKIVFIGQKSRFPSQNLGWIECGEKITSMNGHSIYAFKSWHYRPELKDALRFHESQAHVWNPGYFATTAGFLFSLYKQFAPVMHSALLQVRDAYGTEKFDSILDKIYPELEKLSFDNLILEKMNPADGRVIEADLGWSDVGAWESLKEALAQNKDENVSRGKVMLEGAKDCLVFNYAGQTIVGIDLSEILVINTEDVLLLCPKNSVPKIKKFVESLSGTPHEDLT